MSNQKPTITVEEILGKHIDAFTQWVMKFPSSNESKSAEAKGADPGEELPFFIAYLRRFLRRKKVAAQLKESVGLSVDGAARVLAGSMFLQGNKKWIADQRRKHPWKGIHNEPLPPHSNN
jgi:hypothetical protein